LTAYAGPDARVFRAVSSGGDARTYAVVPLIADELYLMSSWRVTDAPPLLRPGITQYLPPLVMWAVGLLVAGWASERLVNRHMRVLHRSIARFSQGDRSQPRIDMAGAPRELQEVGNAFVAMTDSITRSEAALEDTIHQKEVLLREVHHRVKNNLQLIASIMNMQMRRAHTPEVKQVLKGLQDRIMSLATIHRGLYQTSGLADIHADELLSDIVRQIMTLGSGPDRRFDLDLDIDDIRMTPDQAVPLSLLLTEAVTNAMKYTPAEVGTTPRVSVHLKREDGDMALLSVLNPRTDQAHSTKMAERLAEATGLGTQLLQAFAMQVGGTLTQEIGDETYKIMVRFAIDTLDVAEDRSISV
jgi:two-component sensor histidine kinase